MPRPLRLQFPGAIYLVTSRGNGGSDIVRGPQDRELFVSTLAQACEKCGWRVHAWCLMTDHFHAVIETPQGNLVSGMKWLLGTYTVRYNTCHRLRGHLFSGRYKSVLLDDCDPDYLRVACDYIHLNPARAGLIGADETLDEYRGSSYRDYLAEPESRPLWLRVEVLFKESGLACDDHEGRAEFARQMEAMRLEPADPRFELIRRGWRFGSQEFLARMLKQLETSGQPKPRDAMELRARQIIAEELCKIGWDAGRVQSERKGHADKVAIARKLRRETTVTLQWIAVQLHMGVWTYVSNLLREPGE